MTQKCKVKLTQKIIRPMPRVLRGDLSAHLSAVVTYQLISADTYQHPADKPTLDHSSIKGRQTTNVSGLLKYEETAVG